MLDLDTRFKQEDKPASTRPSSKFSDSDYINIKLHNQDSDLLVIHEAAKLIGRAQSPDYAIHAILRMMSQVLGLNRGRILLPEGDQLRIRYSYGLTDEEQQRGVYESGEGITGKVMNSGQLVVIENIDEEPGLLFRAVKRKTLPQEVVSYIALPIMDGNNTIGVLACHRIRSRMRPFNSDLVILRTFSTFVGQILKINRLLEDQSDHGESENHKNFEKHTQQTIIGRSDAIASVLKQVEQVADVNATVLLNGESGTGKECFARLLHLSSHRKDQPFVALNCAAIPDQLLEAELFGHERGAFTGAVGKKQGKFELAQGGTLFLDEIGDLNAELQTKLLRVLETRSLQRVGGVKEIALDVRIVVATHKNLMQAVNDGLFRLDLFYRLNVFPIHLPALRQRQGDIALLAAYFLQTANAEYHRHAVFEQGVVDRLNSYQWPGNIRQLENVIKRAVLLSAENNISTACIDGILAVESQVQLMTVEKEPDVGVQQPSVTEAYLPIDDDKSAVNIEKPTAIDNDRRPYSWVDADEAHELNAALKSARGNKTRAAKLLGMTTRQFSYRLKKLGLS